MSDRLAADAVFLLHLVFILFAVFGGLLVLINRRWLWLHLPALCWGFWIEASHGICPLTPLENIWRERAGDAGYHDGFIEHYLVPLIYPTGLTAHHQSFIAVCFAIWTLAIYTTIWLRRRRRSTR